MSMTHSKAQFPLQDLKSLRFQPDDPDVTTDSLGRRTWWFASASGCWIAINLDTGEAELGEGAA